MFIRAADKDDILLVHPEKTNIDIGRNINARQVAYMKRPIGIREGRSDQRPFKFFSLKDVPY